MAEQMNVTQSTTPERSERRRFRRRLESSGAEGNEEEMIFGIPVNTRAGKPKHPVALLHDVVCKRLPPVKIMTYREGEKQTVSVCFVGNKITEGRGDPRESRDQAINSMLNKLGYHSESGYASENPHSPSNDSAAAHDEESTEQQQASTEEQPQTSTEEQPQSSAEEQQQASTEQEAQPEAQQPRATRSNYGKLMAVAKEKFPPVKYDVVRTLRSPSGPVYITRCSVKHFVTYGEGGGPNGKQLAKVAAAEVMLERMKTLAPLGSEEEDYHVINQAVVRAAGEHHLVSVKDVKDAKLATNRVLPILVSLMARTDRFFHDYFVKAFYGGSFFDRVTTGANYEVFFVFWHSGNLLPVDTVKIEYPKLRIMRRDRFSKALFDMSFLGDRDVVLAGRFQEWFLGICKTAVRRYRVPEGLTVSSSISKGTFVLKLKEDDGPEIEVKFKPCFAFPTLWRLPGSTIDVRPLKRAGDSEWYVVPERVSIPLPPVEGKKRANKRVTHWTFVAPAGERAVFHDTKVCKPLLRLFLDLNGKLGWNLPELAIKNMFMDEVLLHYDFDFWSPSDAASLLMMMLGKLESCLRAGYFPTVWESTSIKISPRRAQALTASADKLRGGLLASYRKLMKLEESRPRKKRSGSGDESSGSVSDKRAIYLEDVHALLSGEKRALQDNEEKPTKAGKGKKKPKTVKKARRVSKKRGEKKGAEEKGDGGEIEAAA